MSVGCRLKILWGKSQATPIGGQGKTEGRSLPPVPGLPAGECGVCVCMYSGTPLVWVLTGSEKVS